MKTILFTILALLAFAGNSILCRLALGENAIDAVSFTWIRLLSGIIFLVVILKIVQPKGTTVSKGSWKASFMLFLYAISFSFAYISLETGMGALILFSAVQITIIMAGLLSGNKLHYIEWLGAIVAFSGFVYLVTPGLTAPPLIGFILMSLSGVAWGFYTLAGKGSKNPLSDTSYNFIRTIPFVVILVAIKIQDSSLSLEGILLAILSGGVTSGVGYTIWYMALGGLSAIQAAVVQLFVPVIAALGGVVFANEILSIRLVLSSIVIFSGILTVILGKHFSDYQASRKT
ncbi:MAG: DMT family transporter [Exilibacterium sp.]